MNLGKSGTLVLLDKEGWGRGANSLIPLPAIYKLLALVEAHGEQRLIHTVQCHLQ
jgi:hypothetical protein